MSVPSSKRKKPSHDNAAINSNSMLALVRLIANIVDLVRESGYSIYERESIYLPDTYTFYITIPDKDHKLVSSVSIGLVKDYTLTTPRTRSLKIELVDMFYIHLVTTESPYRGQGWATLLLIYTISYLQLKYPNVKIFILKDKSEQRDDMKKNIYNSLGFVYIHLESTNLSKRYKTITTHSKKKLDFNIESIDDWVTVRCLGLINDIRAKSGMSSVARIGGNQKSRKQSRKQVIKRTRKQSRKQK